jgi:hypothetical protein
MPNELFGSVGFALSADRRRPKTLAGRLTKMIQIRQVARGDFMMFRVLSCLMQKIRRFWLRQYRLCN